MHQSLMQYYSTEITSMWKKYEDFAPTDFMQHLENYSIKADRKQFCARLWEMQLATKLLDNNIKLKKTSTNEPDICSTNSVGDKKIWIECCKANERELGMDDIDINMNVIDTNKHILRCTTLIAKKQKQYQKWRKKGICKDDEEFIIAINGHSLSLSISEQALPDIIRSVYPIGEHILLIDQKSGEMRSDFRRQVAIKNANESPVETTTFCNPSNSYITGILFSDDAPRSYGAEYRYCYIPNYYAKNPCSLDFSGFAQIIEVKLINDKFCISIP